LILDLSEDGKFVSISAFRATRRTVPALALKELRTAFPSAEIQFFDAAHIAGREHLEIAAINALHAFKTGIGISRSLAMETLLYASAQRQIDAAIAKLGVTQESKTVAFVAFSETKDDAIVLTDRIAQLLGVELDERLLDEWSDEKAKKIMVLYGISSVELEAIRLPGEQVDKAVKKAVAERVALLSTRT
jgi:tRNA threonylcarbamoyladenosine modification (KEOPS) complex Cgi121 subunit